MHIEWWDTQVSPRPIADRPAVKDILHQSTSGAAAFLAALDDDSLVWVKALGNPQGDQVLVTEHVCAEVGRLLGARVADSPIVDLPEEFDGTTFGDPQGYRMRSGPAYATRHIPAAVESWAALSLESTPEVVAGLCALWDLFLGGDAQWLYPPQNTDPVSFDHSLWLTRGEGDWDRTLLQDLAQAPWDFPEPTPQLTPQAVQDVAGRLLALSPSAVLEVLNSTPLQWCERDDLAALGWFIHYRAEDVAGRLGRRPHD